MLSYAIASWQAFTDTLEIKIVEGVDHFNT